MNESWHAARCGARDDLESPADGPIGTPSVPTRARAGMRTLALAGFTVAALGMATADTSTWPTITTQ